MRRCVAAVRIMIGPTDVCISSMLCSSCLGLNTWLFRLHFILGSCAELVQHGRPPVLIQLALAGPAAAVTAVHGTMPRFCFSITVSGLHSVLKACQDGSS